MNEWKNRKLKAAEPDKFRFKITKVLDERVLAFRLEIDDIIEWFPKSHTQIGIDPSGYFYVVDMPEWLAKSKNLI